MYDALGGGLFSDAAELPVAGPGAVAAAASTVPVMEVRSKAGSKVGRTKPPLHPAAAAAAPKAAAAANAVPAPAASAAEQPSLAAVSVRRSIEEASPFAPLASLAAESPTAAEAAAAPAAPAAAAAAPSLAARSASRVSPAGTSGSKQVAAPDSGMSVGGGGSMLKTLGHSLRHMLPRPLRKFVDGGWAGWAGFDWGSGPACLAWVVWCMLCMGGLGAVAWQLARGISEHCALRTMPCRPFAHLLQAWWQLLRLWSAWHSNSWPRCPPALYVWCVQAAAPPRAPKRGRARCCCPMTTASSSARSCCWATCSPLRPPAGRCRHTPCPPSPPCCRWAGLGGGLGVLG